MSLFGAQGALAQLRSAALGEWGSQCGRSCPSSTWARSYIVTGCNIWLHMVACDMI